jgi:hypothetical protein
MPVAGSDVWALLVAARTALTQVRPADEPAGFTLVLVAVADAVREAERARRG